MAPEPPRPARELRRDALWELVGTIRRSLAQRGEILPAVWVEETVESIARGTGLGWFTGPTAQPTSLALLWAREGTGYGHLHSAGAGDPVAELSALATELLHHLPPTVHRLDVGATGVTPEQEVAVGRRWSELPGTTVILRHSMVRDLSMDDVPPEPAVPEGVALVTVRKVPFDELCALDWRSYRGTPDETLLSESPAGNREMLENAFAGLFGTILDDASPAARTPDGTVVGFAVTCQEAIGVGILLDVAVAPEWRRKGLGGALLLRMLRALLALGYRRAHLWVTDGNAPARALYDRLGFRPDASAAIYRWSRPAPAGAEPPQRQSER